MQPGLTLVPTPIGHLKDITLRALETLKEADLIACEDTRVTLKLLNHYGIKKPLLSYNDHNGDQRRPGLLKALAEGKHVALVSDAGTPMISDPGFKLVREAIRQGVEVIALPGPSSVLPALCLSGLPADRFFFAGFLPAKKEACRKDLHTLAAVPSTLIFFESTRRLAATLALLLEGLGDRKAAVLREISKLHEEARRGTIKELLAHYETEGPPKGEAVIVVGPPEQAAGTGIDAEAELTALLAHHSVKEAASILAAETGRPRKELYALALRLKDKADGE